MIASLAQETKTAIKATLDSETSLQAVCTTQSAGITAFLNTSVRIPDHLEIEGTWNGICVCGHPVSENIQDMVFKCVYRNGSYSLVTPTISPEVWGETEGEQAITFSYEEGGVVITASKSAYVYKPKPVGGILFYIDSSVEGFYQFFDAQGNPVDTPAIGTDCTDWACAYAPMEKDKFYVSYNQLYTSKYWGGNGTLIGASGIAIGTGKTNTAKAIGSAADVTRSIWETIRNMRTNNLGGCDDWYVPARAEVDQYKTAVSDAWFTNHIWSSSELNATNGWYWMPRDRSWYGNPKNYDKCVFGIRSFGALSLVSLSVSGEWENMQIKGDSVDFTGLVFTASFSDGSTQIVTPTVSPSVWSASGMQTATFSYTYNGITKSVTSSVEVVDISIPVGGIIFYIDDAADGTYRFWDANGDAIEAPTVGTDCTGWTYRVEGATKDKFYVAYSIAYTSKHWGYYAITTGATGNSIGSGKTNTSKALSVEDTSSYKNNSMFTLIKNMRENAVGGCNDWYMSSEGEYAAMAETGNVHSSIFRTYEIWSSTEANHFLARKRATNGSWANYGKNGALCAIPVRSF